MSKMKHLLRKLHIGGGGLPSHQRLVDTPPVNSGPRATSPTIESSQAVTVSATSTNSAGGVPDFCFLEEEFQVQLALAISVSDPNIDSAQIDAANRVSLAGSPVLNSSISDTANQTSIFESLSLRYWSYNVVNYNEKILDGFYDVHCVSSNSVVKGNMPSLIDLHLSPVAANCEYEVIMVNRRQDTRLTELERKVHMLSLEIQYTGGLGSCSLVQKIAEVVVSRMGGLVSDADEMSRSWRKRNIELCTLQSNIILPLGCLDIGLSRHRALLFKVLADKINLPCMLVKGSYYTGTDDGAVNVIQFDDGSEYIIDLMGAPGTLIPVEVPSSCLVNAGYSVSCFSGPPVVVELPALPSVDYSEFVENSSEGDKLGECDISHSEETFYAESDAKHVSVMDDLQPRSENVTPFHETPYISMSRNGADVFDHKKGLTIFSSDYQAEEKSSKSSDGCGYVDSPLVDDVGSQVSQGVHVKGVENLSTCDSSSQLSELKNTSICDGNCHSGIKLVDLENRNPVLGDGADWEILWENLQIGERIGIGSYGEVYLAELNGTEVAVKKFLDQDFSGDALMQFRCEIEIMLRLRHPNVVLFMGAVTRPPNLSILTEFLPRGSLYKILHRPNPMIDEKRRLRMAVDVAKGMNYLHTIYPTVVHRDLKSPNLLVDKNWVVKVCDFGLSRLKHHTFLSSNSSAGTPEWMAPEVLRNEPANEKCDIYSFGVILWELATYQVPWQDLNPMQVVGAVGFQNRRLDIPAFVDPSVADIIRDCWQMDPHLRPSFAQLISALRRVPRLSVETDTD